MSRTLSPLDAGTARAERERRILCARWGHSRIRDFFFGYHYCARCGNTLGDSLGGAYSDTEAVYLHHMNVFVATGKRIAEDCPCPENVARLTKKDLKGVPRYNSMGFAARPPWKQKPEMAEGA